MKSIPIFLSLLVSTGLYAAKNQSYQCSWHEKNVDLFQTKFKEFLYSEKGMFYYYISNDQDNVYIDLRIFDENVKHIVLRTGITTWINTDGKKETRLGIKYPAGHRNQINDVPSGTGEQNTRQKDTTIYQKMQESSGNANNSLLLIGFDNSGPALISLFGEGNFRGTIYSDKDNYLYYELVLPISKLPLLNQDTEKKQASLILGFSHESVKSSAMHGGAMPGNKGMRGGGMHGGGMHSGGMRGGGMHAGGMQGGGMDRGNAGNQGNRIQMPGSGAGPSEITWIKNIKLAKEIK